MKNADQPTIESLKKLFLQNSISELSQRLDQFLSAKPNDLDALNLLGLLEQRKGNVEEARRIFEQLYEKNPGSAGILLNLGSLINELGDSALAISKFKRAIALKPDKGLTELTFKALGQAQKTSGQQEEALESFRNGLAVGGSLKDEFQLEIAHHYRIMEDYQQAVKAFEGLNIQASDIHQLECIYRTANISLFQERAKALVAKGRPNPLLGALIAHSNVSLETTYDNPFCKNPLNMIFQGLLPAEKLSNELINSLVRFSEKQNIKFNPQPLLTNGNQSYGNLLQSGESFVADLETIILACVKHYRKKFQKTNEPFLKKWPAKFIIYAWLVNIKSSGHLRPHMHKEGWLSGSIYLDVPKRQKNNEGGISFSLHDGKLPKFNHAFPEVSISVEKRQVIMFPSSLFHRTLEFKAKTNRVSLAFDVIPT